jgi:hypothetical protein
MRKTSVKLREIKTCPDCDRCGAGTRLFGIELHPTIDRSELHTFVCGQCDAVQTEVMPLPR